MTRKSTAAPTMKDVAAEAGVALGTVSKVFNNIPVGEEYRVRVLDAARKLGYRVNSYARGLKTNKTYTAALVWPTLRHPFFSSLADAIIGALMRRGYRTIVTITNYDSQAEQRCIDLAGIYGFVGRGPQGDIFKFAFSPVSHNESAQKVGLLGAAVAAVYLSVQICRAKNVAVVSDTDPYRVRQVQRTQRLEIPFCGNVYQSVVNAGKVGHIYCPCCEQTFGPGLSRPWLFPGSR